MGNPDGSSPAGGRAAAAARAGDGPTPAGSILLLVGFACTYFAAARLGTGLHLPSNHIAIAWPASGVALGAFQLVERRRWWLLGLGIGLANIVANWAVGVATAQAALATAADLLEAAGGALILQKIDGHRVDMTRFRHTLALCLTVATVTPLCAVIGTVLLPPGGGAAADATLFDRWRQWVIVDGVGIIFVTPAILGVAGAIRLPHRRPSRRQSTELSLLVLATVLTTWLAISADLNAPASSWTSRYLAFPFLALAALRAGPAGAAVAAFGMSAAAIATAIASSRVLTQDAARGAVLALQVFISVATLTTLGISALDANRRRARKALLDANRELAARTQELEHEVARRSESEAREAGLKDDLTDVIDSMPLALIALDRDDRVQQWNRRAEVVLDLGRERALGRPAPEILAGFWSSVESSRARQRPGEAAATERLHLERGGGWRSYDVTFYPLARGYIQGGVVMIGDVTEQERLEEVIMQSEKMISLGGLAAGMAHEINNPLGIIAQAAQNVERRTSPDLAPNRTAAETAGVPLDGLQRYLQARGVLQFISDIRSAAARAAVIVSNMLEFSRRAPVAKVSLDLTEVLDRALTLAASDFDLRKQYDFRKVDIVRAFAPSLPRVEGVVIELEQVFLNLIKNAAQAMALGGQTAPRLKLTTGTEGKYVVVTVEDNGPGMDEITRRRVFEPFFTTKPPGVGTGLGLSVSFAIITRNHKGTISVRSTKGAGAAFTVRIPVALEAAA